MEKVRNILKPKVDPQKQLREWQRRLRRECLNIDRQIRDIQREEKNVQKAIREAAKRNDMGSAKALAKEIIRSRRTVNRLYENKAQLNSISMHLGESVAIARTVGHLSKSAEVMKIVNNLMKAPEMAVTMQKLSKEITKAGVIEEIVNDAVDSALDSEDIEEETEEEIDKVLTAIAGETAAQLPEAVRKERLKQPAQSAEDAEVYGDDEWSFGYCEQGTGVFSCPSGKNPIYTYRECIVLGKTNFSIFIVNQILRELSREWPGHSYDLLSKNCNHFCDEFCERLGVPKLPGLGKCQRGCCCGCLNFDI